MVVNTVGRGALAGVVQEKSIRQSVLLSRLKTGLKHVVSSVENHAVGRRTMTQNCSNGVARHHMLALLGMLGLALAGLVQHSTTVSILALSDPMSSEEFAAYVANTSYVKMYCQQLENTTDIGNVTDMHYNETEEYDEELDTSHNAHLKVPMLEEDRRDSLLRESFLWGALISPLPGFFLAQKIGAKRLFGAGVLAAGALSLFVPAAWGSVAHVILRAAQGAATGVMWPALHVLAATWCPQPQRSFFVSGYAAWSVGCAAAALLGPSLVRGIGRDFLFYLEGALTLAWFTAWSLLVANTPASAAKNTWYMAFAPQRPAASSAPTEPARPLPVPWSKVLTSAPVWGVTLAVLGGQWGQATIHLAGTKYLQLIYGFELTENRMLFALPHIGFFMCSLTFGLIADHVIGRQIVSPTTMRKMLVYIAHFWPAAILFVIGYTGCDPSAPAALYVAAVIVSSALAAGAYTSALEIAPNYAGAVFAICHTAGAAGGLIASYVITEGLHGSFPGSWRLIFGITTLVLVTTASIFLAFGSGAEQSWNKTITEEAIEIPTVQHEAASVESEAPEQEAVQQNLLPQP